MIDEIKVQQMIQDALQKYSQGNMFGVSNIPIHNHTGIETGQVDGNDLTFALPYFKVPIANAIPTDAVVGAICVVGGTLYIRNNTAWQKVGLQS